MTCHLLGSVRVTLCYPKNTELCTWAQSIAVFPAVTFNNRISAKLGSKKRQGGRKIKTAWDHCYHWWSLKPWGSTCLSVWFVLCHLVCSQWAGVCLLGTGTGLLSADWEKEVKEIALRPTAEPSSSFPLKETLKRRLTNLKTCSSNLFDDGRPVLHKGNHPGLFNTTCSGRHLASENFMKMTYPCNWSEFRWKSISS